MNPLEQLLAEIRDVDAQIDALLAHDDLTVEQRADHDRLQAKLRELSIAHKAEADRQARKRAQQELEAETQAAKAEEEAAAERQKAREQRLTVARGPGARRIAEPDSPPPTAGDRAAARTAADAIPASARKYGPLRNFKGTKNGLSAESRAARFGMWALATLSRQLPNRYHFRHAVEFVDRHMAAALSKDATGLQYLIPEEFTSDIIDLREQYGVARRLLRVVPMTSDTKTIPRRQGGLTAYFVGEGAAGTESNKTWDQVRLTAKKLMVLSRTSNEVVADAVINWGDDLAGEIAYAFAEKEDQCAFNGDGTSTYGGIQGIRSKLQDVDGAGTDSFGLATGSGNAYSELALVDFEAVAGKLPQFADRSDTVWVAHRSFYYNVMLRLELAAGGVTSNEIRDGDRKGRPMFLGYPVEFAQVMPSTEANSQVCAILGALNLGAAFGDRSLDEVEFSDTATIGGESLWERDELGVRGKQRFDINVHDVGTSAVAGPIVGLQTAGS